MIHKLRYLRKSDVKDLILFIQNNICTQNVIYYRDVLAREHHVLKVSSIQMKTCVQDIVTKNYTTQYNNLTEYQKTNFMNWIYCAIKI